jgi:hypothetical protein
VTNVSIHTGKRKYLVVVGVYVPKKRENFIVVDRYVDTIYNVV